MVSRAAITDVLIVESAHGSRSDRFPGTGLVCLSRDIRWTSKPVACLPARCPAGAGARPRPGWRLNEGWTAASQASATRSAHQPVARNRCRARRNSRAWWCRPARSALAQIRHRARTSRNVIRCGRSNLTVSRVAMVSLPRCTRVWCSASTIPSPRSGSWQLRSEADAGHGVQLDAVRRLAGHVVDLIEEAEPAQRDPLVHALPARGGVVAGHERPASSGDL